MRVLTVSVAQLREIVHKGKSVKTGIFKEPVIGPIRIGSLGVDGDRQADLRVHGGPDKAVYVYPAEHYAYWQSELARGPFPHGQFGENLTIEGLTEETVCIGDVLRIGGVVAQVTQPRVPCFKLAVKMGEGPAFVKRFLAAGRLGFYLRVLEEGDVTAGDAIFVTDRAPEVVTVAECIETFCQTSPDAGRLRRVAEAAGLSEDWRRDFERRLTAVAQ